MNWQKIYEDAKAKAPEAQGALAISANADIDPQYMRSLQNYILEREGTMFTPGKSHDEAMAELKRMKIRGF